MFDGFTYTIVATTFLLAGVVKGVIGLGLPTVSLAVLTATIGLQSAMALLLVPSFVTNVWQAVVGGHARAILARLWLFMLAALLTIWVGVSLSASVRIWVLTALLGLLLVVYSMIGLCGLHLSIPKRRQVWAGPLAGILNGVLTGMTGSFVVPGVMYLQAISLPRNMLVQAMGMLFTVSTVGLAVSLNEQRLLTTELGMVSVVAVAPALMGMVLGQRLRKKMSAARFRRVFFVALLALGLYILIRSL